MWNEKLQICIINGMQSKAEKKSYKKWAKKNKAKINANQKSWVAKNKKKAIHNQRKGVLKYFYNLSWEDYQQFFKVQNNCCAICFKPFTKKNKPHIDHCHKTKKVRGLLHRSCNLVLGFAGDNQQVLQNAIIYLQKTSE